MNKRFFFVLTGALLSLRALSADTSTAPGIAAPDSANTASNAVMDDLKKLVGRINDKLKAGKDTEADLADNLREFDALQAKYKDAPPPARVQIPLAEAQLYLQVLEEPDKALDIFKEIKKDYSDLPNSGKIDGVINSLQAAVEAKKTRDALVPGKPFPDFDKKDLNGKPLSVSNYKGKIVLVDFWATWCVPCLMKLPEIQKAYDKYHDKGFEIIGVSLDEDRDHLEQFTKEKKMPWPQFFDGKQWENELAIKYGIQAIPVGFLLDRDGKIIATISSGDDLDAAVEKALGK